MAYRRRSKFGNVRTEVDGIKFHSKKEAARYEVLRDMQAAGSVTNLRLQVPFRLFVNGKLVCKYISDFVYTNADGVEIVEDVKGRLTDVYRLKKKLMKACLDIDIVET
jgi:hypothetical protein